MKIISGVVIVFLSWVGLAQANETHRICVSEHRENCPDNFFICDTKAEDAGAQLCTVYTQEGKKVSPFKLKTLSSKGGGKCGTTVIEVTCITK